MNFASFEFWLLLIGALICYLPLRNLSQKGKWDREFLLSLSFVLFAFENFLSFAIFICIGCWVYLLLHLRERVTVSLRKSILFLGVGVALLPLFFYKYWSGTSTIPIGLSFYTFQLLSLVFDSVRKSSAIPRFRDYWCFASFFPQIVAGPIERRDSLLPQLQSFKFRWQPNEVLAGSRILVLGFFYKLAVADNLASSCNWITSATEHAWAIHLANFLFGFRIYFDFCGYSLMAYGLAKCIGVRLTMNFHAPYWQRSPQEFWRCWHVSLSRWFRDYIYVPLGGKNARSPALLILLVFGVSGVWHGAGWNFVLWGLSHGFILIGCRLLGSRLRIPTVLAWGLTLLAMMTCWLSFYQTDSGVLGAKIVTLLQPQSYLVNPYPELLRLSGSQGNLANVVAAGLIAIGVLLLEGISKLRKKDPYCWSYHWVIQATLVICTVLLAPVESNGFVYFDF